ncbi:hypothetical protein [Saccharospirillum salsuginis]|uniref:hypothetical protein n=1 Tax=Saccharospirillum salsuginis TaxID=418750 RepID=UPI001674EABF|nr:hypothetical protein [Saccharospirillum salsuginis]
MDYQSIGKALENAGKEIQKVNNRLDKVLEKLIEFEDLDDRKQTAIEHIQSDEISEALNLLKSVEKDQSKARDLKTEEASLREQLETLREQAERIARGEASEEEDGDAGASGEVTELKPDSSAA